MAAKWFSIIIAPHNRADRSWRFKVPAWALWTIFGIFAAGVVGLVSLGVLWNEYRANLMAVEQCRAENTRLLEANRKIALLEDNLAALSEFQSKVRQWVGLPPDSTQLVPAKNVRATASGPIRADRYSGILPGDGWQWPARGWISRGFDARTSKGPPHVGIDIVAAGNEKVHATRAGRVVFCGWHDRLGNLIIIDHGDGYESRYGHNAELLIAEGDRVLEGQEIAIIGNTGISSAPHLHFEILRDGEAIDPMSVLPDH